MMESMSLLALELNEARQREVARAAMAAAHSYTADVEIASERAQLSPVPDLAPAPAQAPVKASGGCGEAPLPRAA
jgi:hypothetical protein